MATSLTYTTVAKVNLGNVQEKVVDVLADAAYTTGGYTLASADYSSLGIPGSLKGDFLHINAEKNVGGVEVTLDRTNGKLLFWEAGAQATTTISSKTVRVRVVYAPVNYK